ncbi:uncharacterized protein N7483_007919 [Penicillium malachiteum]|uniref:uncharacterized protein n=1 Tax=Penicillium malachiteum TaxID=1324776 RepID=UPI002548E073|nr:uncharacterized protein N7483_007919 [Penicillium malachiteum]KAJ5726562.1 hypothetical protein N7483_007919 [Penicillium malachiteum]
MPSSWKRLLRVSHRSRKNGEHGESIPTRQPEEDSEIPAEGKTDSALTMEAPSRMSPQTPLLSNASSLWHEAHALLKEKDAKLVDAYKTALLQEADAGPRDELSEAEMDERLKVIIESRLKEIENSRVKINIAGREVNLQKSVRRSIETVLSVKDLVTTAVSSEVHASLAWAGVLILLNPIAKAVMQSDNTTEGFAKISDLLAQYRVIEGFEIDNDSSRNLTSTASEARKQLKISLRENFVKLYAAILDYHIRLAKRFSRSGFFRALEDLTTTDDWQTMLETIITLHDSISGILRTMRHDMLQGVDHKLGELERELEKSRKDMEEIKHNAKVSR